MSDDKQKIVVVKRGKKASQPHHGGAWKVAYADFVTAMMAFFLVMWIIGMDEEVRDAIQGYFQNPMGFRQGPESNMNVVAFGGAESPPTSLLPVDLIARQIEEQRYRDIGEKIKVKLESAGLGEIAAQVEIIVTEEGLRIELVEGEDGNTFFGIGSARLTSPADRALRIIATELRASSAPIVIEGHTDATRYSEGAEYGNWELSTDRANSARDAMESAGLGRRRVAEIRGYADRQLRVPENPYDNANRRISILLPFTTKPAGLTSDATNPAA